MRRSSKGSRTYDSDGNSQDSEVSDGQNHLLPVLEVSTLVHVEPEDCGKTDWEKSQ